MRIKQIKVKDYGPIKQFQVRCRDIEVIFGNNEAGKTALVDAITTALFQKKSIFKDQDRFDKQFPSPEKKRVTLVLEHMGQEYFFPGSIKFEKLINLPHYHLARLFIIRAGDLSLREDKKWQDRVKEFLSGIPVKTERLKEKIAEQVGLTPTGNWSDRKPLYIKSKIEEKENRKKQLLEAIDNLKQIREKEKKLQEKKERGNFLKQKLEKIRMLRVYKLQERVRKAYTDWCREKIFLQDYERFNQEDVNLWRESEGKLQSYVSLGENYRKNLKELEEKIVEIERESASLTQEREKLTKEKDRILRLSILEDAKDILATQKNFLSDRFSILLFTLPGTGLILMGIFLLLSGKVSVESTVSFLLTFILTGAGVCLLLFSLFIKLKNLALEKKRRSVLSRGKEVWPGCESVDELVEKYENLDVRISQIESKLDYIKKEKDERISSLQKKREELESLKKEILHQEETIRKLKDKTKVTSLSQLEDKLREKQKINLRINSNIQDLTDSLGTDDPLVWKQEAEKDITRPDIPEEELLREKEIEEELSFLSNEIERLTTEIISFTQGELGRLKIKQTVQIWQELEKIEDELSSYYQEKRSALLAWNILEQIGKQMEDVFRDTLLDEKSGVSFYFKKITSDRYKRVSWQQDSNSIYVEKKSGEIYPVEILSSGTQDQLFFSLRLGILKKALPSGAFLLLDDAFLTSDTKRREEQVRVCQRLGKEGWQIFYFTVDEHLRDLFRRICEIEPLLLS